MESIKCKRCDTEHLETPEDYKCTSCRGWLPGRSANPSGRPEGSTNEVLFRRRVASIIGVEGDLTDEDLMELVQDPEEAMRVIAAATLKMGKSDPAFKMLLELRGRKTHTDHTTQGEKFDPTKGIQIVFGENPEDT